MPKLEERALALSPPPDTVPDDGWRPIETAPKDGTQILVACPKAVGVVAWEWVIQSKGLGWWRWQAGPVEAAYGDYDPSPIAGKDDLSGEPTHWRPLPPPPESSAVDGDREA